GANRLASNSLLEGMVFGARLSEAIASGRRGPQPTGALRTLLAGPVDAGGPAPIAWRRVEASGSTARPVTGEPSPDDDPAKRREQLQRAMTAGAGVLRSARSLGDASSVVAEVAAAAAGGSGREHGELANLAEVAGALLRSALSRCETRGAHARVEYPDVDPAWRCRLVHAAPDWREWLS
ncbi:MAG: L-aspartate oxidase, partial [Acidimicrobiales bacterium]